MVLLIDLLLGSFLSFSLIEIGVFLEWVVKEIDGLKLKRLNISNKVVID